MVATKNIGYVVLLLVVFGCKKQTIKPSLAIASKNEIKHAKNFSLQKNGNYSILKIIHPWPGSTKIATFILQQKGAYIPDSLKKHPIINVPIQTIVTTSTTHLPALILLGKGKTLIGFPNTTYIASPEIKKLVEAKKIMNLGQNEALNTEALLDLHPDVVVGFGMNASNKSLDNLERNGIKVIMNGDWNESTPLARAEWIKFFGALYCSEKKATNYFNFIEKEYTKAQKLTKSIRKKPSVLSSAIYQNDWFLPQGNSWAAVFLKNAGGDYLWKETKGTASVSFSFEKVLDIAKNADFWIAPGNFSSLDEMKTSNPHYQQFKAFKTKNIYSYATKKRQSTAYYFEWSGTRPDIVLKDLIKIFHPNLLPKHRLHFYQQLQ